MNFQMLKPDLEKEEEPEIKLPTSVRSQKKQQNSIKTSNSALLTMPKPLTMWLKPLTVWLNKLWKILKDDAVKVLHSICQQIWKTQLWPQDWKRSVSFQSQRKAMPKNAQTTAHLHSSHLLAKKCSKFSKPGFNST